MVRQKLEHAGKTGILSLGEHGLKEVPSEVLALTGLKTLDLAGNALKSLPAKFADLRALKTLKLDANMLGSLPDLSVLDKVRCPSSLRAHALSRRRPLARGPSACSSHRSALRTISSAAAARAESPPRAAAPRRRPCPRCQPR